MGKGRASVAAKFDVRNLASTSPAMSRKKILSMHVVNQRVRVHVAQLCFASVLWQHVVVVELVHHDLAEIQDSLPKVHRLAHHHLDSAHVHRNQSL